MNNVCDKVTHKGSQNKGLQVQFRVCNHDKILTCRLLSLAFGTQCGRRNVAIKTCTLGSKGGGTRGAIAPPILAVEGLSHPNLTLKEPTVLAK